MDMIWLLYSYHAISIMQWLGVIATAIAIVLAGVLLFQQWKILDRPGPDLKRKKRVPTMQGIFLAVGVFATLALFFPDLFLHQEMWGMVMGAGILLLVVSADDILYMLSDGKS